MMLDYHTGLDKLGLKIEFDNAVEQREILDELSEYILKKYKSVYFKEKKGLFFKACNKSGFTVPLRAISASLS